jgi:hypothetical protein
MGHIDTLCVEASQKRPARESDGNEGNLCLKIRIIHITLPHIVG